MIAPLAEIFTESPMQIVEAAGITDIVGKGLTFTITLVLFKHPFKFICKNSSPPPMRGLISFKESENFLVDFPFSGGVFLLKVGLLLEIQMFNGQAVVN